MNIVALAVTLNTVDPKDRISNFLTETLSGLEVNNAPDTAFKSFRILDPTSRNRFGGKIRIGQSQMNIVSFVKDDDDKARVKLSLADVNVLKILNTNFKPNPVRIFCKYP
jgi:hypothetical protein